MQPPHDRTKQFDANKGLIPAPGAETGFAPDSAQTGLDPDGDMDEIEHADVKDYEEGSSGESARADEDFYAEANVYHDIVGDPQETIEAANALLHATIDDLVAAEDGGDLQPIHADIFHAGDLLPTNAQDEADGAAFRELLRKLLFSPLRGSKGVQGREKHFKVADKEKQVRFKTKSEILSFYLMKGLLYPGIQLI